MIAVIQRVTKATVSSRDKEINTIEKGWMILLGILKTDNQTDLHNLAKKISSLRAFRHESKEMHGTIKQVSGEILVVSQVTLGADLNSGNRPNFSTAAPPTAALELYNAFVSSLSEYSGIEVKGGIFGADMQVEIHNDGPVTFILDSRSL